MGAAQNDPLALLPLGTVESLVLPGESYKLAFTPGLLDQVYVRGSQQLLPADPADVLKGGADQGGYVDLEGDRHWWIPSGRVFFSPGSADTAAQELAYARLHFFLPHRSRNPFHTDAVSTESFVNYDIFDMLMVETRDALGNVVTVNTSDAAGGTAIRIDYRVLQPYWVTDPNGNRAQVAFDTLGMVVGTAVMGKPALVEGDSLALFEADLSQAQIDGFYDAADPHVPAPALLRDATTRIIYDLDRFQRSRTANPNDPTQWLPAYAATLARETHASDPLPPQGLKIQISFSYSDGFGREIQKKIQAEPGPLVDGGPDVDPRWVGSGWTIFNNKGKPVRQYEPFFSKRPRPDGSFFSDHRFEFGVQVGVSPILFYDPVERVVATLHPNHTWEKVVFDPWQQATWDVNDTVLNADGSTDPKLDQDVQSFFARLPDADYLPTWYEQRSALAANDPEHVAADKAAIHRQTPTVAHLDTLGRPFLTLAQNRFERDAALIEEQYATRVELDIEGNQRAVIDANDRVVMRYAYDMLGNRIHQASMEAGERWMLNDVAGQPIRAWDSRDHQFRSTYDQLRRPTESFLLTGAGPELLIGRTVYGEIQPNPEARNLRGRAVQNFDQAGIVTSDDYDFKGNPLSGQRQLAREYKTTLDWKPNPPLEVALYASSTRYDALNRPTELTTPHTATMQPSIIRPSYNEANLLEGIKANLRGAAAAMIFVNDIDYNAKGQRTLIEYGNRVSTSYEYEELTFRLSHMQTMRGNQALQDLRYIYDPAGNITRISDDAQDRIFHSNQAVLPSSEYLYDAVYRLIGANGREHKGDGQQIGWDDRPRMVGTLPNDGQALQNYVETYLYDAVGNIMQMIHHQGRDLAQPGQVRWNRRYQYALDSNRLLGTSLPGDNANTYSARYEYDAHGNMTRMPHLPLMQWDYRDQLQVTSQQVVNNGDAREKTYYVYDAAGQRVRKVTELATGSLKNERIYLGGFEIYRQHAGADAGLVRETLHIMDGQQRIALVETKTQQSGLLNRLRRFFTGPEQLIRYQFGNHLGSASLELDDQAQVISYEEYYPYGSTSYQAVRSQTEAPKRYRYTSMERDEESGLAYHSARYYATWLGRWTSCDPEGLIDGLNLYQYTSANPIVITDSAGTQGKALMINSENVAPPSLPEDLRQLAFVGRPDSTSIDPDISLIGEAMDEPRTFRLSQIRKSPNYIDNFISFGGYGVNPATSTFEGIRFIYEDSTIRDVPLSAILANGSLATLSFKMYNGKIYPVDRQNERAIINPVNTPRMMDALQQMNQRRAIASETNVFFAELVVAFAGLVAASGGQSQTHLPVMSFKLPKKLVYALRIRQRAVQDPGGHNFPYSFDKEILSTKPTLLAGGGKGYALRGYKNNKEVVYNIVVRDEIITHRDMVDVNKWKQRAKSFGWQGLHVEVKNIPKLAD